MRRLAVLTLLCALVGACGKNSSTVSPAPQPVAPPSTGVQQVPNPMIEYYPSIPSPFNIMDFGQRARDFDNFVYDWNQSDKQCATIAWDASKLFVLMPNYYCNSPTDNEAIEEMASVVGATLVGIDKSNQGGLNYAQMLDNWFNPAVEICTNNVGSTGAYDDWWYELHPNVLYYHAAYLYPTATTNNNLQSIADQIYNMVVALGGSTANFNHQGFNFVTMQPYDASWTEPDAAAAAAVIEYWAYKKFGNSKYMNAVGWSMGFLESQSQSPYYEVLLPNAPYIAARLNAEGNQNQYDVNKYLTWQFTSTSARNWGGLIGDWNGYDAYGLVGSGTDWGGGYAFFMNSAFQVAVTVPVARYEPRFAQAIGIYVLNAANAAQMFFADQMPTNLQDCPQYHDRPEKAIAYEGVKKDLNGISPYASGDNMANGGLTDLGMYGGTYVGYLGGIINPTSDPKILQLDCLKTDFYRGAAYPTYLLYNPYQTQANVTVSVGSSPVDVYDAVSNTYLAKNVSGNVAISIPANYPRVLVYAPPNSSLSYSGMNAYINGVFVSHDPAGFGDPPSDDSRRARKGDVRKGF